MAATSRCLSGSFYKSIYYEQIYNKFTKDAQLVYKQTEKTYLSSKTNIVKAEQTITTMLKEEAASLILNIETLELPVGKIVLASSKKGLCMVTLAEPFQSEGEALNRIKKQFACATLQHSATPCSAEFLKCWNHQPHQLKYHLKGTDFQIAVWRKLLEIPFGETRSYGQIAKAIGHPSAFRAAGTAVGDNPVFYAIPCHRVLPVSGKTGNYFWGTALKQRLLEKEQSE